MKQIRHDELASRKSRRASLRCIRGIGQRVVRSKSWMRWQQKKRQKVLTYAYRTPFYEACPGFRSQQILGENGTRTNGSRALSAWRDQQRSETTQPVRGEEKHVATGLRYRPGRSTTLITPSSLSRNFLYIAGASSRLAGCVTTKLGSILPSSMSFRRGLV
jgi:hypothetical protein